VTNERTLIVSGDSDVVLCALLTRPQAHRRPLDQRWRRRRRLLARRAAWRESPLSCNVRLATTLTLARSSTIFVSSPFCSAPTSRPLSSTTIFTTPCIAYRSVCATSAPRRFVYDRAADSLDVDALLQCLVAKSNGVAHDDSKRWTMFAERFASLVPDSVTLPPNAESFLYGVQWSLQLSGRRRRRRSLLLQAAVVDRARRHCRLGGADAHAPHGPD
jgi:hypothetical protein